ncbi:MAG: endonuclease domain-containing protein [Pseudomonadota bacterium]
MFRADAVNTFRFTRFDFDESQATAELEYAFDDTHQFIETITFPNARLPLDEVRRAALTRVLYYLHLVAGVSYYKAAVPPQIEVGTRKPDTADASFMEKLYLHGLGEFAYQNQLNLQDRIKFPTSAVQPAQPRLEPILPSGVVLPLGGGKDSLVSLNILQHAGIQPTLFSVGNPPPIQAIVQHSGLPHIWVQRRISPDLLELNKQGALNGHVPISAIIALISAAAAILYDFDTVVMSNERSANVGNLSMQGLEINHQYSKSLEFERDFAELCNKMLPGFRYFSLLRPLSELDIARLFSQADDYDAIFSSCNASYRINNPQNKNWCLDCPKCRFVFLSMAPFMDKARVLNIFGKNLLSDSAQQHGFDALIGHGDHKPFECVGEIEESLAAFWLLSKRPEWQEDHIIRHFVGDILPALESPQGLVDTALSPTNSANLPEEFRAYLDAYRRPEK